MNVNNKVIVWSGGFDSTALILRAIANKQKFRTVSFALGNNPRQSLAEKDARERIMEILRADAMGGYWTNEHIDIPTISHPSGVEICQALLWTFYAGIVGGNIGLDGDGPSVIEFGYVRGDDVWHYKDRLLFAMEKLINGVRRDDSQIKFEFPFEWEDKKDLLRWYDGRELLLPLVSTVENGPHWSVSDCPKGKEMRELWEAMLDRVAERRNPTLIEAKQVPLVSLPVSDLKESHEVARAEVAGVSL